MESDSTDTGDEYQPVTVSQSTDTATAAAAATAESTPSPDRLRPVPPIRVTRQRRRPARFLETVQAHRLTYRQSATRTSSRLASCDVRAADHSHLHCRAAGVQSFERCCIEADCLQCCRNMP